MVPRTPTAVNPAACLNMPPQQGRQPNCHGRAQNVPLWAAPDDRSHHPRIEQKADIRRACRAGHHIASHHKRSGARGSACPPSILASRSAALISLSAIASYPKWRVALPSIRRNSYIYIACHEGSATSAWFPASAAVMMSAGEVPSAHTAAGRSSCCHHAVGKWLFPTGNLI